MRTTQEIRRAQEDGKPEDDVAWATLLNITLRDAMKMKKVMLRRKLTTARAHCPDCDGMLHAGLAGSKNHIRFMCDGTCGKNLME